MTSSVVITGASVRCALGEDVEAVWQHMLDGRTRVSPVPSSWDGPLRSRVWSPLPLPAACELGLNRQEEGMLDPATMIAVSCAERALADAGFELERRHDRQNTIRVSGLDPTRCGVFVGTGVGGVKSLLDHHAAHLRDVASRRGANDPSFMGTVSSEQRFTPFAVPMMMSNAPGAYAGIKLGLTGPNVTFGVACAASTVAIGHAFKSLRRGELDVALAGGTEYLDDGLGGVFRGFDAARALTRRSGAIDEANRPFDTGRQGFLFSGGGACMLVLERAEVARARGARAIASITGYGETFDAHSLLALAPDGAQIRRCLRAALEDAGIEPRRIGYVNSHGTGTVANDPVEADAILATFGDRPVVNSTKSLLGHTIGASGAIETLVTALTLRDGVAHPSRCLEEPIAPLNFAGSRTRINAEHAVSESFAFGGHNAALVLSRLATAHH